MTDTTSTTLCENCHRPLHKGVWVTGLADNKFIHAPEHGGCQQDFPRDHKADLAVGKALAEQGAAAAFQKQTDEMDKWRERAKAVLSWHIQNGEPFSSDDIAEQAGDPPNPNAMGGLFTNQSDRMKVVDYQATTRKSGHGRIIRVWQGR